MGLEYFGYESYGFECLESEELKVMENEDLASHMRDVYSIMLEGQLEEAHRRRKMFENLAELEKLRRYVNELLSSLQEKAEDIEDEDKRSRALSVILECGRRVDAGDVDTCWLIAWQLKHL